MDDVFSERFRKRGSFFKNGDLQVGTSKKSTRKAVMRGRRVPKLVPKPMPAHRHCFDIASTLLLHFFVVSLVYFRAQIAEITARTNSNKRRPESAVLAEVAYPIAQNFPRTTRTGVRCPVRVAVPSSVPHDQHRDATFQRLSRQRIVVEETTNQTFSGTSKKYSAQNAHGKRRRKCDEGAERAGNVQDRGEPRSILDQALGERRKRKEGRNGQKERKEEREERKYERRMGTRQKVQILLYMACLEGKLLKKIWAQGTCKLSNNHQKITQIEGFSKSPEKIT